MSEFKCHQTGEICPLPEICVAETLEARELIEMKSKQVAERTEKYIRTGNLELPGLTLVSEGTMRPNEEGILVLVSEDEEVAERTEKSPSIDAAKDIGALTAHSQIENSLPLPKERVDPGSAYDSYDQLSQSVCLRGTIDMANHIIDAPREEAVQAVSQFIILAAKRR